MDKKKLAKVIKNLMSACDELMAEYVSKKRSADWEVINSALMEGQKAIREMKS